MSLLSALALLGLLTTIRFFIPTSYAEDPSPSQSEGNFLSEGEEEGLDLAAMDVQVLPAEPPEQLFPSEIFYQQLYPDMVCEIPVAVSTGDKKMAYLTFDDGPSALTPQVLAILEEYNIKATFFVVTHNNTYLDLLPEIAAAGHTIGVHSDTHDYKKIYASVDAFLDDFYVAYQIVLERTCVAPTIFRFPGGSINSYNLGCYEDIIAEMLRRGFRFYDWNVSTQDAKNGITPGAVYDNALDGINRYNPTRAVVLAHDSTYMNSTVEALPRLIETLQERGYEFDRLDNSVIPVAFSYK